MDKGALKMMLIVGFVLFGFILLTKPKGGEKAADTTSNQSYSTQESTSPQTVDFSQAPLLIRQAGIKDEATGIITYNYRNVSLQLKDSVVSGLIAVTDSMAISYDSIIAGQFPAHMASHQQDAALKALNDALITAGKYQSFARYMNAPEDISPIVMGGDGNSLLQLEFSRQGGMISKAILRDYKTYFPDADNKHLVDTADVIMFDAAQGGAFYDFTLRTANQQAINTKDLYFTPHQVDGNILEMTVDLGGGAVWGYRYTINPDKYIIGMEIIQRNVSTVLAENAATADLEWYMRMPREENGRTFEERNSGIYYKYVGDKPSNLNGLKTQRKTLDHGVRWLAYKNQFFSTVIIPRQAFDGGSIHQWVPNKEEKLMPQFRNYVKFMDARMTVPYNTKSEVAASFDIFIGPNLYPLLKSLDKELQADDNLSLTRLIPLGWSWLRWINTLIIIPVFNFLSGFISNYGLIIFLLTVFIKIILFPFTYKSYISQAKMRVLAPEIKEINDKYPGKENAMVRQQKTMALYSRAGASPMSGCLPLLLQMPILIAMFSFFPSCIELRGESFLWAKNLAAPDIVLNLPFTIPFYGNHVSLFCLLMTVCNIIYTRINMKSQPSSSSMPGMKWMMYLMPVMFLFFFNDYAAALSYYYFLSLLLTIIQTWIFRRCLNEQKLRQKMMENAAKPRKKSGFMARLEEAQRRQQAALREQQKNRRR